MKKLLTLLFSTLVVFSLAMPVPAQDGSAEGQTTSKAKKEKKEKKQKKEKRSKKKSEMTDLK